MASRRKKQPQIVKTVGESEFAEVLVGGIPGEHAMLPGSRMYKCSSCEAMTCVSPSGQRRLTRFPQTKLICFHCFEVLPDTEISGPDMGTLLRDLSGSTEN